MTISILTIIILLILVLYGYLAFSNFRSALLFSPWLFPGYLLKIPINSFSTNLLELSLGLLIVAYLYHHFIKRPPVVVHHSSPPHPSTPPLSPIFFPLILLALSAIIALSWTPSPLVGLGSVLAHILEPLAYLFILHQTLTSPEDHRKLWINLKLLALTLTLYTIIQSLFQIGLIPPWDIETRVTGIFDYPNASGLFLTPILAAAIFSFIKNLHRSSLTIFLFNQLFTLDALLIITGITSLFLSSTEAGIVALIACTFLILLFKIKTPLGRMLYFIVVSIVLSGTLILLPNLQDKLLLTDHSGLVRRSQWQETISFLADHPLQGAGPQNYPTAIKPYHSSPNLEIFQYPHNIFLNFWVEYGLLGLLSFLWLISVIIYSTRNRPTDNNNSISNNNRFSQENLTPAHLALLALLIHGLVDVPWLKNDLAFLTILIIFLAGSSSPSTSLDNHTKRRAT